MTRSPLDFQEIITKVAFKNGPPTGIGFLASIKVKNFLKAAKKSPNVVGTIAVWSDGTWALLAHNSAWNRPNEQQLVRAYRIAFALGIQLRSH